MGIRLAVDYAALFSPLVPLPPARRGPLFEALIWPVVMFVVLPLLGDGVCRRRIQVRLGPPTLGAHCVYGAVLGLTPS